MVLQLHHQFIILLLKFVSGPDPDPPHWLQPHLLFLMLPQPHPIFLIELLQPHTLFLMVLQLHNQFIILLQPHLLFLMLLQPHPIFFIELLQPHPLFNMVLQPHQLFLMLLHPHSLLLLLLKHHRHFSQSMVELELSLSSSRNLSDFKLYDLVLSNNLIWVFVFGFDAF